MNSDNKGKDTSGINAKNKKCISDEELFEQIGKVVLSEDSDSDSSIQEDTSSNKETVKPGSIKTEINDDNKSQNVEDKEDQDQSAQPYELFDFTKILQTQEEIARLSKTFNEESIKQFDKRTIKTRRTKCDPKEFIDNLDISTLLEIGEKRSSTNLRVVEKSSSDDEVPESEPETPTLQTIEITIKEPDICTHRKKHKDSLTAELNRLLNLKRKRHQLLLHKSNLVCIISRGMFMNTIVNTEILMGLAMSLVPSSRYYPPSKVTKNYMEQLLKWFTNKISLTEQPPMDKNKDLFADLVDNFGTCSARSPNNLVLMFVALARSVGLRCRLVMNLCPVSLRPPTQILSQKKKKSEDKSTESDEGSSESETIEETMPPCGSKKIKSTKAIASPSKKPNTRSKTASLCKNTSSAKLFQKKNSEKNKDYDESLDMESPPEKKPCNSKTKDKIDPGEPSTSARANTRFRTASTSKNTSTTKMGNVSKARNKRKVLSSDDEKSVKIISNKKVKNTTDMWVEVYVETEKKWLPYDVINNRSCCVKQIYLHCHAPVSYILAWNNDGTIKDVTRRYVPQWHICLKSRIDTKWWQDTLKPWSPLKTKIDMAEDEELERIVTETPLPSTIGEYKNHPHYALKRHLLKFEAIYPPTAVPLGQIHGEDVFARVCVVELHTKESWIKEGKVLKANQEPYKIVKARPKREKGTGKLIKDIPLNLYGKWQVEDYIPPTAVDGKVPRNDFGNVELYKPSMIPKGTVHLQLPGLMRIARKMDIDCAPAVVGWEFRGHGSHPVLDGVVVCEEFKQQLVDAWSREMDTIADRNREAAKQRSLNNWRKLVRALLLRDKLTGKYKFKFSHVGNSSKTNRKKK